MSRVVERDLPCMHMLNACQTSEFVVLNNVRATTVSTGSEVVIRHMLGFKSGCGLVVHRQGRITYHLMIVSGSGKSSL